MEGPLIIEPVVGYMLKVLKSGVDTQKFDNEFKAIRHGNYDDFLDLVKGERPPMVVWHEGTILNQDEISQKTTCDFAGLLLAGPSLNDFFSACLAEYGNSYLYDNDEISNDIYSKVVLFEISLRMHANNHKLLGEREQLVNVITKLCAFSNIPQDDIDKLQGGRKFVNEIKHNADSGYKRKFATWSDGISTFEEAYKVLEKHKFII